MYNYHLQFMFRVDELFPFQRNKMFLDLSQCCCDSHAASAFCTFKFNWLVSAPRWQKSYFKCRFCLCKTLAPPSRDWKLAFYLKAFEKLIASWIVTLYSVHHTSFAQIWAIKECSSVAALHLQNLHSCL